MLVRLASGWIEYIRIYCSCALLGAASLLDFYMFWLGNNKSALHSFDFSEFFK